MNSFRFVVCLFVCLFIRVIFVRLLLSANASALLLFWMSLQLLLLLSFLSFVLFCFCFLDKSGVVFVGGL